MAVPGPGVTVSDAEEPALGVGREGVGLGVQESRASETTSAPSGRADGRRGLIHPIYVCFTAGMYDTRLVTRSDGGGASVTLRGHLSRANWNTGRYEGYSSRTVDLQRRTTTGEFRRVRAVTTDEQGVAQTQLRGDDGCFRFAFRGSGTAAGCTATWSAPACPDAGEVDPSLCSDTATKPGKG